MHDNVKDNRLIRKSFGVGKVQQNIKKPTYSELSL
jgi:hypothetical protein